MLPLARYRFTFTVTRDIHLPAYAGSMLRGAFGHALRGLSCMTRQKECTGCPLHTTCPYPAIFAPVPPAEHSLQKFSQIPVPYVIEPEHSALRHYAAGQTFCFDMVLMGRAQAELPLVTLAWQRALGNGLGQAKGCATLESVEEHTQEAPTQHTAWPEALPCAETSVVDLHFITPLRLQENGKALPPNRLTPRALLMALVRRTHLLAEFHLGGPFTVDFTQLAKIAGCIRSEASDCPLHWQDWQRYSSRQQRTIQLGGVIGTWRLAGALTPFMPYLQLGTLLHVGKEAAFGLGHYRLLEHTSPNSEKVHDHASQGTDSKEKTN